MILRASLVLLSAIPLSAQDWPQYHGPSGDRSSAGTIGASSWTDQGPPVVWRVPTIAGFSSFTVADQRAFTLVRRGKVETLVALDANDGAELWTAELGKAAYDGGGDSGAQDNRGGDGPRSTPAVDGGLVYAFGADLTLHCRDAATGKPAWKHDLLAEFDGRNIQWQNAAAPLIEGDLVLVAGGGAGQSLLAFDKRTGTVAWKTGDETITHATPIAATIHGQRHAIFYVRSGLVALDPKTGEELWRIAYPFRTSSAASPVVHGDIVYVSAGYGVGAGAYRITATDGGFGTELLWRKRNSLMNHWSTPVCRDGHLYGMFSFKKYGEGPLCCVSIETGETMWSVDGFGPGNAITVGDTLVALSDAGEVVLAAIDPSEYREIARADVLAGKCWSSPSFADGQLYVRSTEEGARLDLRPRQDR